MNKKMSEATQITLARNLPQELKTLKSIGFNKEQLGQVRFFARAERHIFIYNFIPEAPAIASVMPKYSGMKVQMIFDNRYDYTDMFRWLVDGAEVFQTETDNLLGELPFAILDYRDVMMAHPKDSQAKMNEISNYRHRTTLNESSLAFAYAQGFEFSTSYLPPVELRELRPDENVPHRSSEVTRVY